MAGYNVEHNYRKDRKGGGVSLFISEEVEYQLRVVHPQLFERIFVSFFLYSNKFSNIRPPANIRPPLEYSPGVEYSQRVMYKVNVRIFAEDS